MKIITFGSCLSRYTANHFCRIFGGAVISSVYHNRSDAFVGKFIEKTWVSNLEDEVKELLNDSGLAIMMNQCEKSIGMHRLKNGIQFFEALDRGLGDIVIIDNFIDISARLLQTSTNNIEGIFLRPHDFLNQDHKLVIGDHLTVDLSVSFTIRIIKLIKEKLPKSTIIFINFPNNTYPNTSLKVTRLLDYEKKFFVQDALIIPALNIHRKYQTEVNSHFQPPQYAAYAGIIYQYLSSKESGNSIQKWQVFRRAIRQIGHII
jgi:hypothetical protein